VTSIGWWIDLAVVVGIGVLVVWVLVRLIVGVRGRGDGVDAD